MTIEEMSAALTHTSPPASPEATERFEAMIGQRLPDDYREFLTRCNGGYGCGYLRFTGPMVDDYVVTACLNHVGGLRQEDYFSLVANYENYQTYEVRLPKDLIWIADDPLGNAICLGISGVHRNHVFFWDHENEPDPDEWDGRVETAGNLVLLADSFTEFFAGLKRVAPKGF